jgi:DNA mismatch repair protein MutS
VDYETSIVYRCEDVWHPSLDEVKRINNNVVLDKSMILTGPNAGGKSTMIKSILLSILLAQTITVSNCTSLDLSPIYFINSQMNIPDCKGKESLFEAEMYRSKKNIDILPTLDKPSIIFMDEIFNSTNPVEGIAGAYAIIKNIASYPLTLAVVTTHFLYLTKLAKEFPNVFKNYKMNVVEENNTITYPYKLTRGISKQYIAIELLKQNGFNEAIISDALAIKKLLLN